MPSLKNRSVRLRANAKINLSLNILGKRNDGYHDIDSIMQSVSLHDEVEVMPAQSGIKVICNPSIESNLAGKAAEMLLEEIKLIKAVEIRIIKHIPIAAGLAGGSADAAAVLTGMNILFGLNLHHEKLMGIGAKIGSDVPFCLTGGTCRVTGRGEHVERINPQTGSAFILAIPKIQVSTKEVYAEFDRAGKSDGGNELEAAAARKAPEIKKIKDLLIRSTGGNWKMSGSGPSLFMELMDISESEKHTDAISKLGLVFHVVKRMDKGVEITQA